MNDPVTPVTHPEVENFQAYFDDRFATVYYNSDKGIIICSLKTDYVPIDSFKYTFNKIGELVKSGVNNKFIFDKRSLRAFHQPSMEWYFTVWKKEMLTSGLSAHRKILPDLPWFKKAVEIARGQLEKNHTELLSKLDIQYSTTVKEAVNN